MIDVDCKLCQASYTKQNLNNYEIHTCAINMSQKLISERKQIDEEQTKLDIARHELRQVDEATKAIEAVREEHDYKIIELKNELKKIDTSIDTIYAAA